MRRRWGGFSTAAPPSLLCTRISPHHHHQAASTTTTQLTITHLKEQTKIILTSTCSKTHSGLNPINHALLIFLVFERLYRPENALISCFLHSYGHHLDESWWMFSALMREKDKSSHCSCQSIHQCFYTSIALRGFNGKIRESCKMRLFEWLSNSVTFRILSMLIFFHDCK